MVCWLTKAIKKLRTVAAEREKEERKKAEKEKSADANIAMDFWRGMGDVDLLEKFLKEGGTERAPMSTTLDPRIALKYASKGRVAVLLRIRTSSCMQQGADLTWLSAFPDEQEFLYPPITFLKSLKPAPAIFQIGEATFKVVDIEPHMA